MLKLAVVLSAVVLAGIGALSASGSSQGEKCSKLKPKGGGTVINGVFVPLQPGEYIKLCH